MRKTLTSAGNCVWALAATLSLLATSAGAATLSGAKVLSGAKAPAAKGLPPGVSMVDWAQIKAEYERNRYAAAKVDGQYRSRNFAHGWLARFDNSGFTLKPDSQPWTWGLELRSYGFSGQERPLKGLPGITSDKYGIRFASGDLEHWYVNDPTGLEEGFTLARRPAGSGGLLRFTLGIRGGLKADRSAGPDGVRFLDAAGNPAIIYNKLKAWDADGKPLSARFEPGAAENSLRIAVDETNARYPITIDPTVQQAYLKASNTGSGDNFGYSVAISGDTIVVGATGEDSNATGSNGNQTDNSSSNSGAAYVFVRNGSTWSQQAYLKASNPDANDNFGFAVAISADTIVVGAPFEDSGATGVNGNQADNGTNGAGAAYVFVRSGSAWSQQAYLKASSVGGDIYGWAVAIDGDTVAVGAQEEDSNATGINGNQADNGSNNSGATYVYTRSGSTWTQQAYVKASNTRANAQFGWSLGLSGNTLVVGARGDSSNATGVNGNQGDTSAFQSGAAYVFVRSGTTWSQQAYLKASNTEASDNFGFSVGISGDTVVVGALDEDSNATGMNGNGGDNSAASAGAAYVFVRSGTNWSQQAYLKASNTEASDNFGQFVGVSGDNIIVGANREDSSATGVGGSNNNSATDSGAAYIFTRTGTVWTQANYVKASNTGAGDQFGISVAVSGNTFLIGAHTEDSNATGVDGNGADNSAGDAGAAYVFAPSGVSVTITSSPTGRSFDVSGTGCAAGTGYTMPATLSWTPGSSCTVTVSPVQSGGAGIQYVFGSWENSSTASVRVITAPASATTYTAGFTTQYQVTTVASPAAGGSVTAGAFVNAGSNFVVTATTNSGYSFTGFSGALTGTTNPQTLVVNAASTVTANFTVPAALVGLYRFENSSNLGLDSSPLGNNLTSSVGSPAAGTGKFGGGLSLNGSSALTTSNSSVPASFPTGNATYSIAAWVKSTTVNKGIIGWGNFGTVNGTTALKTDNPGFWHYWWANDIGYNSVNVLNNAFHHIVVTFDGTSRRAYLDGSLVNSDTPGSVHNAGSGNFFIGRTNTTEVITGTLDDIAVFTGALTQAQITTLFGGDYSAFLSASTTTTVSSSAVSTVFGQSVTFTATVTTGTGTATGTVTFKDGATTLGTGTLASGTATFATSALSVATHSITAVYGGDPSHSASTSSAFSQVVNKASTTTTVSANTNPTVFGQSVIFTATVAATSPGAGTTTGTVTFLDGVTTLGTVTLSSGQATFTTSVLSVATHPITAVYAGDSSFAGGTSPVVSQVVDKAATVTSVVSSTNPSIWGGSVTFTAAVAASSPGTGTPSGAVTFNDGATVLGSSTLTSGQATLTTSALTSGAHSITAVYGGASSFAVSTSLVLNQTVNKATPVITWASPAAVTYGTALSATQLNASAAFGGNAVTGTFVYSPQAGSVLNAGTQTLSVTFTPTDTSSYNTATASVSITVNKATPAITWAGPAPIVVGTPLSATQLNATAAVGGSALPGSFTYSPAAGVVLSTGNNQTLSVTFAPQDAVNYLSASATVLISVTNLTPVITWPSPADITYGAALSSAQLNATASYGGNSVPGTFVYSPAAGNIPAAGVGKTLSVTFTPADTNTYKTVTATNTINVNKAAPVITWNDPVAISYGTALGSTQLNATAANGGASLAGTFAYTPAAGAVLNVGAGQELAVVFTPADAANFNTASATARITVNKATPAITWANPAAISYGVTLSATQLNALAKVGGNTVPGTYVYTPASGTKLSAGNNQNLSVSFTPTDTANYTSATATAQINVNKATPNISWPEPDAIAYGFPLTSAHLNASVSSNGSGVAGTFTYSPAAGTVLNVGAGQNLSVTFTPTDSANYSAVTATTPITVVKATPNLNWPIPTTLTFGTVLTASQHLNATVSNVGSSVPGTFTYNVGVGDSLFGIGQQTFTVVWTPANSANYNSVSTSRLILVRKIPTMFFTDPPPTISYLTGMPGLGNLYFRYDNPQTNQQEFPEGTFVQSPALGTILEPGSHTVSVTFNPAFPQQYASVTATATMTVTRATPQLTWNSVPPIIYPRGLDNSHKTATAGMNGNSVQGSFSYSPTLEFTRPGTYQVTATFTPSESARYNTVSINRPITISYAAAVAPQSLSLRGKYPNPTGFSPTAQVRVTTPIPGYDLRVLPPSWLSVSTAGGGVYESSTTVTRFPTGGTRDITLSVNPSFGGTPGVYKSSLFIAATNDLDNPVLVPVTLTIANRSTYFYPAPSSPYSAGGAQFKGGRVAAADFNADGYDDVAVVSPPTGEVAVLLGSATGAYTPAPGSPFSSRGANPSDVIVLDFNRDGVPDLAVANTGGDSVQVFRGLGSGSFAFQTSFTAGAPTALATGDVNSDGNPDLLVINNTHVTVWLGNGSNAFTSGYGQAASSPTAAVLRDFNRDGIPDLAVTESGNNSVTIFTGTGNATFELWVRYSVGTSPSALAVDDFNGDGWFDVAVANRNSGSVSVFSGASSGLNLSTTISVGGSPSAVVIGDLNGDGFQDIAATGSNGVHVRLGNGSSSFSTMFGSPFSAGAQVPVSLALADSNKDARLDLVTTNGATSGVSVLLGDLAAPTITWPKPADITYPARLSATQLNAVASFNGTPVQGSIVYAQPVNTRLNAGQNQTLSVTFTPTDTVSYKPAVQTTLINVLQATPSVNWANPAAITFPAQLSANQLNARAAFAGADLPGSFVYTPPTGTVLNPGAGQALSVVFTPTDAVNYKQVNLSKTIDVTGIAAPASIALSGTEGGAAVTNIFKAYYSGTTLSAKAAMKSGTGWLSVTPVTGAAGPITLTVTANPKTMKPGRYTGTVTVTAGSLTPEVVDIAFDVWNQTGALNPNTAAATTLPGEPTDVAGALPSASGDFDGDGRKDVAVFVKTLTGARELRVYFGNGQGGFTSVGAASMPFARQLKSMVAADFNGDGKTDLAYLTAADNRITLLMAGASRTFATAPTNAIPAGAQSMIAGDFNRDGNADLLLSIYTSNNLGVACGLYVLAGNGKAALKAGPAQATTNCLTQPRLMTGDFNRDGNPDVVVTGLLYSNGGLPGGTVSQVAALWIGDGNGGLSNPGGTSPIPFDYKASAVGDTNGDGKLDLVFVTETASDDVVVARYSANSQNGFTLSKTDTVLNQGPAWFVNVDDLDADGKADLLLSARTGASVFLGTGNGSFTPMPGSPFNTSGSPVSALIDDYNGDFKKDVALLNWVDGTGNLNVLFGGKAKPVIQWTPPNSVAYGETLTAAHLSATVFEGSSNITSKGVLAYRDTLTNKTLKIGDSLCNVATGNCMLSHPILVTFTPTDPDLYTKPDNVTVTFTITKAVPVINWAAPAAIFVGTKLSATQLNATATFGGATLAGTFSYNPVLGTTLPAGNGQTMVATFTPTDTVRFQAGLRQVQIDVKPGPNVDLDIATGSRVSSGIEIRLKLTSTGSAAASGVRITDMYSFVVPTQRSKAVDTLPLNLGTIAAGSSQNITLRLPTTAGKKGDKVNVTVTVTYTGGAGTVTETQQVTLP